MSCRLKTNIDRTQNLKKQGKAQTGSHFYQQSNSWVQMAACLQKTLIRPGWRSVYTHKYTQKNSESSSNKL